MKAEFAIVASNLIKNVPLLMKNFIVGNVMKSWINNFHIWRYFNQMNKRAITKNQCKKMICIWIKSKHYFYDLINNKIIYLSFTEPPDNYRAATIEDFVILLNGLYNFDLKTEEIEKLLCLT